MSSEDGSRRGFLVAVTVGGSGIIAGTLAVPAVPYVLDPLTRGATGETSFVRVARLDVLPERVPRKLPVVGDAVDAWTRARARVLGSVWVTREGDSARALSATCPHLGCPIGITQDGRSFACPCHESRFGIDGKRASGPSPRDMDPLDVRVRDGFVEVRWQRFRQGLETREPIARAARPCAAARGSRRG